MSNAPRPFRRIRSTTGFDAGEPAHRNPRIGDVVVFVHREPALVGAPVCHWPALVGGADPGGTGRVFLTAFPTLGTMIVDRQTGQPRPAPPMPAGPCVYDAHGTTHATWHWPDENHPPVTIEASPLGTH